MYIIQFGGYVFPTAYNNNETHGASRRSNLQELSGHGSVDLVGSGPSPMSGDTISKSFILNTSNNINFNTAIADIVGQMMTSQEDFRQGVRLLIATDGISQYASWAKCSNISYNIEPRNENNYWLNLQMSFERTIPKWWTYEDLLFLGDNLETFEDTDIKGYTFGQSVFEQLLSTDNTSFTITNNGNTRVFDGIIEFDGAIDTPIITNNKNKYTFTVNRQLSIGDRYTINSSNRDIKFNGVPGFYSDLNIGNLRGQLQPMVLEPGDNEFAITATTTPICMFRYWYADTWVR